jgi:hypothetical protein
MDIISIFKNSYLFFAVLGSTIFAIQFLLTIIGIGGGEDSADGFDISDSLEGLEAANASDIMAVNFFSLKSIVAFFTFYGWGGVCFSHLGWGGFAIAIFCGLIMMAIVSFLIALMLRLQQSGNINPNDLVGKSAKVYLTIPAGREPGGKVTIKLSGCTREVSAISDAEIKTGAIVVIEQALPNGTCIVKPMN